MNNVSFVEVTMDGMSFDVVYAYVADEFETLQVKLLDELEDEDERTFIESDYYEIVANKAKSIVEDN